MKSAIILVCIAINTLMTSAVSSDSLWQSSCTPSCTQSVDSCNQSPYFCITPSICERCAKTIGSCYACSLAVSNLAQTYVDQGPQTFRVPEMAGACTPTSRALCRYACRYRSWNEGVCDPNDDCICQMNAYTPPDVTSF